jgi:rubrerythrin
MAGFVSYIETMANLSYENSHNKQKHFLICESCFWCASSLSSPDPHLINDEMSNKCPACKGNRIRVIPV